MMVEIKTHGADLTMAQRDTLLTFDQIMRNRRRTPTKALRRQIDNNVNRKIKSWVTGKEVVLKAFGAHSLIFSGLGPDDSEWIKWDNKLIDIYILTNLLRFDLDPDELVPIDFRNHHKLSKKSQLKQATMFSSIDEQKSCARK